MRGEILCHGAQRIHDVQLLLERAALGNQNLSSTFIKCFEYGVEPHAGATITLERLCMLYLELSSMRKASLFPRTQNRITP